MEGFSSLLRSWLRPHRGISQEKLLVYLGFFAFIHNVRKRGKALLPALMEPLVTYDPGIQYERKRKVHSDLLSVEKKLTRKAFCVAYGIRMIVSEGNVTEWMSC